MDDEAWPDELEKRQAAEPDDQDPTDDELAWADDSAADDVSADDLGASFTDQIMRGSWPVRVAMPMEIYIAGSRPYVYPLRPGQNRHHPDSRIITIELQLDRPKVREMMLEQIRSPRDSGASRLVDILLLARVDRACFLETAAVHFVDLLSETDAALRHDACLFGFLRELHEYDEEVIGDVVAKTIRADRAAGARLRDVILEVLEDPQARDALGWLAAAAISDRLHEL